MPEKHNVDLIAELGELALGSRLRRFSDQIMKEGEGIYPANDIEFNPNWFPVYYALTAQSEPIAVTELSAKLQVSHPRVIKTARELERIGLVESSRDEKDGRRRLLSLTAKGSQLKPQFRDIWNDIAAALHEIISESGVDVMSLLCKLEQSHARESLSERVARLQKVRNQNRVEILEFSPELAEHFASINYQWISHYFQIEEEDRLVLDNPVEKIIEPGGAIIFAQLDGEIVGTVALKPENPDLYELTKMGVLPQVRGRQVGLKLGEAILEKAREMKIPKVFLDSNKKLKPALNLYRKLGFEEVGVEDESAYVRCDIRMEWKP